MTSSKKHLTIPEQVGLLERRGLQVDDVAAAERFLLSRNYYRFSGYAREFQYDPRAGGNRFIPGTRFEQIVDLMESDEQLRLLFLEALAIIEVTARSSFAYEAGTILGSGAFYLERASYLQATPQLDSHLEKIRAELMRPKRPTVARYLDGDDLTGVPIWVAIELVSFGAFAKMCWYLNDQNVATRTAASLSIQVTGFTATLHAFSALRNACAHHQQLWNRSFDLAFSVLPKEKRRVPHHKSPGSYPAIVVIKRWLRAMLGENDWGDRVDQLLELRPEFAQGILVPTMK